MIKEIKEKVEQKKQEIKVESVKLRTEAKEKHICACCGRPLEKGRKVYCDDDCAYDFSVKYDYTKSSKILINYKNKLKKEYEKDHPKIESNEWATHTARKNYTCDFCKTTIKAGEKYDRFTRLPDNDYFDEAPFETFAYHLNCIKFENVLLDNGLLENDNYECINLEEVLGVLFLIATKINKTLNNLIKDIIKGDFPPESIVKEISNENFDSDGIYWGKSNFKYIYLVKYVAHEIERNEVHYTETKLNDPMEHFKEYYKKRNGYEFGRIVSVNMEEIPH